MSQDLAVYSMLGVVDNPYADTPNSDVASRVNSTTPLIVDADQVRNTGKKLITYIVVGVIVLTIARAVFK